MRKDRKVFQGGVYLINLSPVYGSEQGGVRPCVCVSNDKNNMWCSTAQFVPLTTQVKTPLPTHYLLMQKSYKFLYNDSIVLAEQITTKSIERITSFLGRISEKDLLNIIECVKVQLNTMS